MINNNTTSILRLFRRRALVQHAHEHETEEEVQTTICKGNECGGDLRNLTSESIILRRMRV